MTTLTLDHARPRTGKRKSVILAAVASLALLSGCATTKVAEREAVGTRSEAPRAIAVAVELADGLWGNDDAMRAAAGLHRHLEQRLDKEGILVHTGDATGRPGTAIMRVRVDRAKGGNAVKRYVIGFGSGNSQLRTTTALELPGERGPALRFSSRSNNMPRPGLIMPIGISAASGKTKTLPLSAGLGLLAVSRGGLDADARNAAKRIVSETKDYYGQVGWRWPGA